MKKEKDSLGVRFGMWLFWELPEWVAEKLKLKDNMEE